MLPRKLKGRAEQVAAERGISLGELIRQVLQNELSGNRQDDPFFADHEVYDGDVPSDISLNHDDYLYPVDS